MAINGEKEFVGLEEIAEYLDEAPSTVRDWASRGKIPFYKRGRRLKFNLEEIRKWDREKNYRATLGERLPELLKQK